MSTASRPTWLALCRLAFCLLAPALFGLPPAPAHGADWPQFGRSARHLNTNPAETAFSPANAGLLRIEWRGHFGDSAVTEGGAAIAQGRVFVAGFDGRLSAFAIDGCGGASCEPLWQGRTRNDITSTPAVAGGLVLVASADRFLHAFAAAGCGAALCAPVWRGRLQDAAIDSSVAVVGGVAYVGDYGGRLYAFAAAGCGSEICAPLWTGRAGAKEQLISAPAVGHGSVFIASTVATPNDNTGRLLVFPAAGCGAAECQPTWTADLGGPAGTRSSPVVAGDAVFVGSTRRFGGPNRRDHLFAFAADGCGQATCKPRRSFDVGPDGIDTTPAVSGHMLYASTQASPNPNTVGVVAAFDLAACKTARCQPVWTGVNFTEGFMSPPALAGGVVFVGKGPASGINIDSGVFAFDAAGCGQRICQALSLTVPGPTMFYLGAPLAIGEGRVAFVSNDNSDNHSNVYLMSVP